MMIRKATIRDFEEVKRLKRDFVDYERKNGYHGENINLEWSKKNMPSRLGKDLRSKKVVYFVAEEKKKLIGYSLGVIEKASAFFINRKIGHIANLFVEKEYRRKGIAKKLIDETIKWFRKNKIKWIKIITFSKNKTAQKIYKKNFEPYIIEFRKMIK